MTLPVAAPAAFDYSIAGSSEGPIRAATDRIRRNQRKAAEAIVSIGIDLSFVKALLPHGAWTPYLRDEVDYSDRTARRLMQVAEVFDDQIGHRDRFDVSAMYLLSADSAPEAALREAADRAAGGEQITKALAAEIVGRHRDAPPDDYDATAHQLVAEYGVSPATILRDAKFATAVDAIAEKYGDEARQRILSGKSGLSTQDVIDGKIPAEFDMHVESVVREHLGEIEPEAPRGKAGGPTQWDKLAELNLKGRAYFEQMVAERRDNAKSDRVLNLYEELETAVASYRKSVSRPSVDRQPAEAVA